MPPLFPGPNFLDILFLIRPQDVLDSISAPLDFHEVRELVEVEEMDFSVDREFEVVFEPVVWAEFGGDCRSRLFLELAVLPKELCSFLKGFEKGEERRVVKG